MTCDDLVGLACRCSALVELVAVMLRVGQKVEVVHEVRQTRVDRTASFFESVWCGDCRQLFVCLALTSVVAGFSVS